MARIVTFSDSFVSASEPFIEGVAQENYEIVNNASDEVLLTIDADNYKSAFIDYELYRKDDTSSFLESGKMQLVYNGTSWDFAKNIFVNDELIVSDITNPEHIKFSMQTTAGVGELIYDSGNMGSGYEGTLRLSIVRIAIL